MNKIAATIILLVMFVTPAQAGFDEGLEAADRGDYQTALREWLPLAKQGGGAAQYNIGIMYGKGQGIPQDHAEAVKWHRLAAMQGIAAAQFSLGSMYALGRGVRQNFVLAYMWSELAASQGIKNGTQNRNIAATKMTLAEITKARRLAREWWAQHLNK